MADISNFVQFDTANSDSSQYLSILEVNSSKTIPELLGTGVFSGDEKYIRLKGHMMTVVRDSGIIASCWMPARISESPDVIQNLYYAVRSYIKENQPDYYLE